MKLILPSSYNHATAQKLTEFLQSGKYTPTLYGVGGAGSLTVEGQYQQVGSFVIFAVQIFLNGTTPLTAPNWKVSLPFPIKRLSSTPTTSSDTQWPSMPILNSRGQVGFTEQQVPPFLDRVSFVGGFNLTADTTISGIYLAN